MSGSEQKRENSVKNVRTSDRDEPFRYGQDAIMDGWLTKTSGVLKKKKKRYCNLQSQTLTVSKDQVSKPDHFYALNGAAIDGDKSKLKINIKLQNDPYPVSFYAEKAEEYIEWIEALKNATSVKFEDYYSLGEKLGSGSFGAVYICKDLKSSEEFAVKTIEKSERNAREMEFLSRELKIMRTALHPNVVKTVDLFDTKKAMYLVMEYLPGGTLHDLVMKKGKLTDLETKTCMVDILRGVRYLHDHGVVHRDLKLKNILIKQKEIPFACKLADFGLSNFVGQNTLSRMALESQVGTPHYVAPEILKEERYGPPVDIWSCGVIAYNLLTGKYPLAGKTVQDTLRQVVKGVVNWERDLKGTDKVTLDFLQGLMNPDYKERFTASAALDHPYLKDVRGKKQQKVAEEEMKLDELFITTT